VPRRVEVSKKFCNKGIGELVACIEIETVIEAVGIITLVDSIYRVPVKKEKIGSYVQLRGKVKITKKTYAGIFFETNILTRGYIYVRVY